jgi:CRISPR-associated protein Csb3
MGDLELPGDVRVALSHLAAYGLAAILEDAGAGGVTMVWTPSLDARARVSVPGASLDDIAAAVRAHAGRHTGDESWTAATASIGGRLVGRLSPRVAAPPDEAGWLELVRLRHATIDALIAGRAWLDALLVGALGEPAYWRFDAQGKRRPDEGASRWEMKTRNRGEDFVAHRLHPLGAAVAARHLEQVRDGLTGAQVTDEVGKNAPDSRTATGLASPGAVDNALAWCALWGLSLLPVVARIGQPSASAGYGSARGPAGGPRENWFALPVPLTPITLARLATVLVSEHLATAATSANGPAEDLATRAARQWLADRGIGALVRFPIGVFGSASAPERRALLGTLVRIAP